jgi:hypothetical protein
MEINKIAYDFATIQVEIAASGQSFGIVEAGCESIEYSWKLAREDMYGGSRLPEDYTEGEASFEGKIKFQRYWWQYMADMAADLGIGLANLEMTFALTYSKTRTSRIFTDTLSRVTLIGADHGGERGASLLMVENPLHLMNIYYNGVDVFGNRIK